MDKAKRHEAQLCGGNTHMFAVSSKAGIGFFEDKDILAAEALGEEIDRLLNRGLFDLLTGEEEDSHRRFLSDISQPHIELANKLAALNFPGLTLLDGKWHMNDAQQ
jgi:hypothetical protein